jgi:16S rRNA (guanine527-N7)-methyltransferase
MHPARIAELLQPFLSPIPNICHSEPGRRRGEEPAVLSPLQLNAISTYIDLLLRWNARMNLTAIRDPEEIVTRHFGESLFAARHLFPSGSSGSSFSANAVDIDSADGRRPTTNDHPFARLADIGSGAGFPGVPIKLWIPDMALTLIESNHKKATFLREVVRTLTFTNVDIQNVRAETLPTSSFDVVTMRAVERLATLLTSSAQLLVPGGRLALLAAESQFKTIISAASSVSWVPPIRIPNSKTRALLVGTSELRE